MYFIGNNVVSDGDKLDRFEFFLKPLWKLGLIRKKTFQSSFKIAWVRYI